MPVPADANADVNAKQKFYVRVVRKLRDEELLGIGRVSGCQSCVYSSPNATRTNRTSSTRIPVRDTLTEVFEQSAHI